VARASVDKAGPGGKSNAEKNRARNEKRKAKAREERERNQALESLAALKDAQRAERKARTPVEVPREFGTLAHNRAVYDRLRPGLPTDRQASGDSILAIGQRPRSDAKGAEIVFLEKGTAAQGFKHITEEHRADFKEAGVGTDKQIMELVMTALVSGNIVGIQGKTKAKSGRPIYEVAFEGQRQQVAVQLIDDNTVLGANPKKFITQREREALLPVPLRR